MNIEKYRSELTDKQSQLEAEIARAREDGLEAKTAEVEDPIDAATSSQEQATAFEESSRLADTLEAVRAALQRIDDGTYGRCLDCGREITEARLNAVPWTPYCIDDQEKHDSEATDNRASDRPRITRSIE